ncbi:transposase [Pyramidobacter sp.]
MDAPADEILDSFDIRRTNAMIGDLNSVIQDIKRCARGIR